LLNGTYHQRGNAGSLEDPLSFQVHSSLTVSYKLPCNIARPTLLGRHKYDCLQVTYLNGPSLKHGTDMGEPRTPAGTVLLDPFEQVVGIIGTSESLVNSIGFNTSWGRAYGPWGSRTGSPFANPGTVYGFYGGNKWGCIGAIGTWVALVPPPSDPSSLMSPSPPPPPTRGTSKSPRFGSTAGFDTIWDDGPSHSGQPCPKSCTCHSYVSGFMTCISPTEHCACASISIRLCIPCPPCTVTWAAKHLVVVV
jgi:hypothetical protein